MLTISLPFYKKGKRSIRKNGETLINCLAYIDLNPVRAGMSMVPFGVSCPDGQQGWFSFHGVRSAEFAVQGEKERLAYYRRIVYEKGGLLQESADLNQGLELNHVDRFRYRTRYFTDSGIIGTKEFVSRVYQDFKGYFSSKHEKLPKPVQGLDGVYSLKRLSESIA